MGETFFMNKSEKNLFNIKKKQENFRDEILKKQNENRKIYAGKKEHHFFTLNTQKVQQQSLIQQEQTSDFDISNGKNWTKTRTIFRNFLQLTCILSRIFENFRRSFQNFGFLD